MDFGKNSINYSKDWDYNHGFKDGKEFDPLVVSPAHLFFDIVAYPEVDIVVFPMGYTEEKTTVIDLGADWICHHFRGWNKPKSAFPNGDWTNWPSAEYFKKYSNQGEWYVCPDEIKNNIEKWRGIIGL